MTTEFPLSRMDEVKSAPQDYRLLERVPLTKAALTGHYALSEPVGDEKRMVILDTETTGMSYEQDRIIELGMVTVSYSPSEMRVTAIENVVSLYEDPDRPIPELITRITGITDDQVKGKRIDDGIVEGVMAGDPSPLVVAHNAKFDRAFFDLRFPQMRQLPWACSASQVNWSERGFEGHKLEYLLLKSGYFYDGHRASTDCLAMAWLFHLRPDVFANLLDEARKRTVVVRAMGAPFGVKDVLKARGYSWHDGAKGPSNHWWNEVAEAELDAEKAFLDDLYSNGSAKAQYETMNARMRFKPLL